MVDALLSRKLGVAGVGQAEWAAPDGSAQDLTDRLTARCRKKPVVVLVDEAHTLTRDVGQLLLNLSQEVRANAPFLLVAGRDFFPREAVTLEHLVDHIDHVCQLAGNANHAAIGGDTDGQGGTDGAPIDIDSVADYPKLRRFLKAHEAGTLLRGVRARAVVVPELPEIDLVDDPDDNLVLATALAGEADYLVTGDLASPIAPEEGAADEDLDGT